MRTLVIETATAACSVALLDDDQPIAEEHAIVGRGHAEQLLPMIAALPGGGRADHILVDCGPGSFTGIRVGVAAARALAFGWGATLAGFSSLPLMAAAALAEDPTLAALAVVIEGGHGEVFMQTFTAPLAERTPLCSLLPPAALALLGTLPAIGSGRRWLAPLTATLAGEDRLPRAADARLLPATFTTLAPHPIYGRAPDAKPMAAA
jgi:tRNA threonylcarbamoyladenosine biosynthesis protein TsaB